MVIPFIQNAWPKELKFRTEDSSKAWVGILDDTGDAFPDVLDALMDYLLPIYSSHIPLYRFHREMNDANPITTKFPKETLALLERIIPDDPRSAPYDLSKVLDIIVEVCPEIETDSRYRRLRDLDSSR